MTILDPFDPNTWVREPPHEFRIYGDDNAQTWCVVDEEDYQHLVRHRWHINKPHPGRFGKKQYFVRNPGWGGHYKPKIYLHVEVMERSGILRPGPEFTMVDHLDDDEWNCRRSNLVWATALTNNWQRKRRLKCLPG